MIERIEAADSDSELARSRSPIDLVRAYEVEDEDDLSLAEGMLRTA